MSSTDAKYLLHDDIITWMALKVGRFVCATIYRLFQSLLTVVLKVVYICNLIVTTSQPISRVQFHLPFDKGITFGEQSNNPHDGNNGSFISSVNFKTVMVTCEFSLANL